jgi:hypothetical protein
MAPKRTENSAPPVRDSAKGSIRTEMPENIYRIRFDGS